MRSIIVFASFLILLVVACSRKMAPAAAPVAATAPATNPQPSPSIKDTATVAAPESGTSPLIGTSAIVPVTGSPMDNEAGRIIYTTKCTKCHQAKPVEAYTINQWQPILKSMVKKTKLDSLENHQVRLYVNTHSKKS